MYRIKKINVWQTAKVFAVIYLLIAFVTVVPALLFMSTIMGSLMSDSSFMFPFHLSGIFILFVPFIYAVAVFIVTAISCAIYNLVAGWTGGIEVELEQQA